MKNLFPVLILAGFWFYNSTSQAQTYIVPKGVEPKTEVLKRNGKVILVKKEWLSPMLITTVQEVQYEGKVVFTKVKQRFGNVARHFDTFESDFGVRVVLEHAEGSAVNDMISLKKADSTVEAFYIDRDNNIKPVSDEQLAKIQENQKASADSEKK